MMDAAVDLLDHGSIEDSVFHNLEWGRLEHTVHELCHAATLGMELCSASGDAIAEALLPYPREEQVTNEALTWLVEVEAMSKLGIELPYEEWFPEAEIQGVTEEHLRTCRRGAGAKKRTQWATAVVRFLRDLEQGASATWDANAEHLVEVAEHLSKDLGLCYFGTYFKDYAWCELEHVVHELSHAVSLNIRLDDKQVSERVMQSLLQCGMSAKYMNEALAWKIEERVLEDLRVPMPLDMMRSLQADSGVKENDLLDCYSSQAYLDRCVRAVKAKVLSTRP